MDVAVIINPMAGKDEPILRTLHTFFSNKKVRWRTYVTQREGHATKIVEQVLLDRPKYIAVHGGDGTVMEAAHALIGKEVPLVVIPGGTANVVAKEFAIPHNVAQSLELIDGGKVVLVDTYELNNVHGFIRVNLGIFAKAVITTTIERKHALGSLAYTIESFKQAFTSKSTEYVVNIDGKTFITKGIGLMITNVASVGVGNLKFHPAVKPHDEILDVLIIKKVEKEIIPNLLNNVLWDGYEDGVEHYQGTTISVQLPSKEQVVVDDMIYETDLISLSIAPHKLQLVVPETYELAH